MKIYKKLKSMACTVCKREKILDAFDSKYLTSFTCNLCLIEAKKEPSQSFVCLNITHAPIFTEKQYDRINNPTTYEYT